MSDELYIDRRLSSAGEEEHCLWLLLSPAKRFRPARDAPSLLSRLSANEVSSVSHLSIDNRERDQIYVLRASTDRCGQVRSIPIPRTESERPALDTRNNNLSISAMRRVSSMCLL